MRHGAGERHVPRDVGTFALRCDRPHILLLVLDTKSLMTSTWSQGRLSIKDRHGRGLPEGECPARFRTEQVGDQGQITGHNLLQPHAPGHEDTPAPTLTARAMTYGSLPTLYPRTSLRRPMPAASATHPAPGAIRGEGTGPPQVRPSSPRLYLGEFRDQSRSQRDHHRAGRLGRICYSSSRGRRQPIVYRDLLAAPVEPPDPSERSISWHLARGACIAERANTWYQHLDPAYAV